MRHRRGTLRGLVTVGIGLGSLALIAVDGPSSADAGSARLTSTATAWHTASRGTQVQVTPPTPPHCSRVVVVGDSLTEASAGRLRQALASAGYTFIVDGQRSRRIPGSVRDPYSGVSAALRLRASWGEADCWVIGLGSNDLEAGAGDPALARTWIDEQLRAVTPGARVWWINVAYRREAGNRFDFPAATATFNAVLDSRALADPLVEVIDWHSVMSANPSWFVDDVHVGGGVYDARTQLTLVALG